MFFQIFISLSLASPWLIKAPSAPAQEFIVYAQNSDMQKISTYFLKCENTPSVLESLKKAQILFLDGDLQKSKNHFLEIVDKKWSCDWSDEDRKMISFSFFRLAQMEEDSSLQTHWLQEAINFDDLFQPDSSVFPPPLLQKYKTLKNQQENQKILLPAFSKKYNALLRNGRFISLNSMTIEALPGKARYTLLSDTFLPEKLFITLAELETTQIDPKPMVYGDCSSPQLHESLRWLRDIQIFFALDCVKSLATAPSETTPASIGPQSLALSSEIPTAEKSGSWIQRNALWIGTAVVGSILIGYQIQNHNKESRVTVPTTTVNQ